MHDDDGDDQRQITWPGFNNAVISNMDFASSCVKETKDDDEKEVEVE